MENGSRVIVISEESEYLDAMGTITDFTFDGQLVVTLDGASGWTVTFGAHDLEELPAIDG